MTGKQPNLAAWKRLVRERLPGYDPWADTGGAVFKADVANEVCDGFFGQSLHLIEGDGAPKLFVLEEWQRAVIGTLFGWIRKDGTRRYRESLIAVPRKNGKTPLAAGIALHALLNDGEPGCQVYSAAADEKQAALVFRHASGMVAHNPAMQREVRIYKSFKSMETKDFGIFKAISSESDTKHGLNAHCIIVDELHAQRSSDLVDVLRTSTASRRQPLMTYITTSDYARESICNEIWDRARRVRDGVDSDPAFLPAIWEAAVDCDWESPATWSAVNPNLGVSVSVDYLQRECQRAKDLPAYENVFKRLHLNIRTEQAVRWIPMESWDACTTTFDDPESEVCYAGLDLASTTDTAACVLWFPQRNIVLPFFWVPEETASKREMTERATYRTWTQKGLMTATPGNVVDYDRIRADINGLREKYNIRQIAVDRWNSTQLQTQLTGDGFDVVPFGQGFVSMTAPTKELEKLVVSRAIRHDGNPVLRWMASNVMAEMDAAGNLKPSKRKSSDKIDGVVALIMAIGLALVAPPATRSIYCERGVMVL